MYETHSSSHAAETVTGPIVFVHGSLSSRHMWASYPAALGSRSASAIDLPGYDEPGRGAPRLRGARPRGAPSLALSLFGAGHMLPVTHAPALTAILRARFPGRDDDIPRAA